MAAIVALMVPAFLGCVALGVDTIQFSMWRRMMQRQADSGAIAGALALAQGQSVNSTVTNDLSRNNFVAMTAAPIIENAPTGGSYAGNAKAVRVRLSTSTNLPFSTIVLRRPVVINVEATGALINQGQYCVVALDNRDTVGISMGGNTTLNLGCGMISNTIASSAVTATGSSLITASPIAAVGGLQASSNYSNGTLLIPYTVPQQDPFASLPNPSGFGNGSNNGDVNSNKTRSIDPGTYSGLDIKGTLNMSPGIYYINKGQFSVGAQGVVNGTGVTIILTSDEASYNPSSIATISMNGGATLNLTATTNGTYAGVLFYQDRRALDSGANKINGNSASKLQGAIYFPGQAVEFTGNSDADIRCVQLVARRLIFTGNSNISNECPAGSGAQSFTGTRVKLVG